jgi:hypothetical protein
MSEEREDGVATPSAPAGGRSPPASLLNSYGNVFSSEQANSKPLLCSQSPAFAIIETFSGIVFSMTGLSVVSKSYENLNYSH